MSYCDLKFLLTFSPGLKTREQIKATVFFHIGVLTLARFQAFNPFVDVPMQKETFIEQFSQEIASLANRWALQFSNAEVALDESAYDSLNARLRAYQSSNFLIHRAEVQQIIPLSRKIDPPLPPPVIPRKPTFAEQIVKPADDVRDAIRAVRNKEQEFEEADPSLCNDPVLGNRTIHSTDQFIRTRQHPGKLRRFFDELYSEALDYKGRR